MPDTTESLLERVRGIRPDLKIEQEERNEEGLINNVLIINQALVFRFARTPEYAELMQAELKILDLVRPRVGVQVPTPFYQSADCMVYPLIPGQTLSRKMVLEFDEKTRAVVAGQLGAFLYQLHSTDVSNASWEIPATRAPTRRQAWLDTYAAVQARLYPLFQKYQVEWAEDLFDRVLQDEDFFNFPPALINGDFASYHILYDPQAGKINGVIDFGMAGLGDAASDFGNLISIYGESFVRKMQPSYPGLEAYLTRARFYALGLELEWVLRGLESSETFWFTAHLGGARDMLG